MPASVRPFAFLVLLLVGGGAPARADWVPDAWTTARVKVSLLATSGLPQGAINVDTVNGVVTLHGKVTTAEDRQAAERAAEAVPNVRDVRNLLQIVPPERAAEVEVADARIRKEIERAFDAESSLRKSGVRVGSVLKGLVRLKGTVRDDGLHLLAIRRTRAVPGVRAVASDVRVESAGLGERLWSDRELSDEGRSLPGVVADAILTTEAKLRLLAVPDVSGLDINVDTLEGVVTLFGVVPTAAARDAAVTAVRGIEGVEAVESFLQIVPESARERVAASDARILEEVRRRLDESEDLDGAVVEVEVENGVVRLTGGVPGERHRLLAATEARKASGVRAVETDLRVRRLTRKAGPS